MMSVKKFASRREELRRKFEEDMRQINEAEQRDLAKKIEPIVSKIGRLAEDAARKSLDENPELLDSFEFKKRKAAEIIEAAVKALFASEDSSAENDLSEAVSEEALQGPVNAPSDHGVLRAGESAKSGEANFFETLPDLSQAGQA